MTVEIERPDLGRDTRNSQQTTMARQQELSPLLVPTRQTSHTSEQLRAPGSPHRWTIADISTETNIVGTPLTPIIKEGMDMPFFLHPPSPSRYISQFRPRSRSTSLPFLTAEEVDFHTDINSRVIKVVVLGESGVGKTTLVQEFVSSVCGEWPDYESVISDDFDETFHKTIVIEDKTFHLEIMDTPAFGTEEFEEKEDQLLEEGDAYLLVYSITNRKSFKRANELRFKLQRSKESETVPIIMVGNKTDLERSRGVSFAEGKHFAALFDCKLIETSASLCHNVDKLFYGVATQVQLRKEKIMEDFETSSGGSGDSGKSSPSSKKNHSKKRRGSTVLHRARGILDRILRRKHANEPIAGYRSRSKSCHVMDVL